MNILISCAGGPAAVGVIKSVSEFNDSTHKVVAIDCDELSVGFHLADKSYVVPFSVEDDFWKEVLKVIRYEKIDLVIPTGDADIVHFSKNKNVLRKMGVTVFMSDYKTIKICQDKLLFYKYLVKNGLESLLPKTSTDCRKIDLPILCKPKRGSGSRGIELWETESQIKELDKIENLHYSSDYIFQEYLPGNEYTIDVLCDLKGEILSIVPRKRLQIKAGISSKGKIIRDKIIEDSCKILCKKLGVKGPVCIQMKEDINGTPKFVEINPRVGGGTYFATLAGVNFMKIILDMMNNDDIYIEEPKEITVLRYYEEVVVSE